MQKSANKATFLASLGAGLEYYDFVIYGLMASTLSTLFFAGETASHLSKTFAIFALGYIARPVGGILFGMVGDTYGRKKTFLSVMLLMAASTFSIGLLPNCSQAGLFAPAALLILRLLQGLSFGAELPGAITVINEHSEKKTWGIYTGFVISSVSLGATLASFVLYVLSEALSRETILSWGWRIPFLLGGVFSLANYFIRKHLNETPEFVQLQKNRKKTSLKDPLLTLIRDHKKSLILGISMTGIMSSLVIFFLSFPTYIHTHFGYELKNGYLAVTWGMIWSAFSLPFCGWFADKIGKAKTYLLTCLTFSVCCFSFFSLLGIGTITSLLIFTTLYQTTISFLSVSYFSIIPAIFSTDVRYTGLSFCYNIVYCIIGCTPMFLVSVKNPSLGPSLLTCFALLGALGGFVCFKKHRSLADVQR
ncbi:MAG: MFS transporter [Verrucomicrobia bacterium]|nr:MFS transporter [Verrucomicrobiota bacterium]